MGLGCPDLAEARTMNDTAVAAVIAGAIARGVRLFDTAELYANEGALGAAIAESGVPRAEVFLQTKYTPISGQDPSRVPYDRSAPIEVQVQQSVAASLRNLQTNYIDCLLLHSPFDAHEHTLRAWRAMETELAQARNLEQTKIYED